MERLKIANNTSPLSAADLEELSQLRAAALRAFVQAVLAAGEFKPTGLKTQSASSVEAKRSLQAQRRKRALAIAESEGVKKRKVVRCGYPLR